MIPFIQTPDLQSTSLRQSTPSAAALAAPAQALGDVARGIASVGGAFAQHAEQIQSIENARMESEARQRVAAELSDFKLRAQTATDPSTLLPELEKTIERTSAVIDDQNLPPILRERLALWHSDATAQTRLQTAADASRLSLRRAGLALQNEMDSAVQLGDSTAFEDVLSRGQEAGLLLPEEAQERRTKFEQAQAYNTLAQAIDADPAATLEQLQSKDILQRVPNLTETNRDQLIRYATQKNNQQKAETWEQIQLSSLDGAILSREDIMQMAKEGEISPSQAGSYLQAYHGPTPPQFDPILFAEARAMIHTYDPAQDETGEQRANIARQLATLPLPKEHIKELSSQFSSILNPSAEDAPKHKLATDYINRIETEWKNEAFGEWFDMEEDPKDARIARKKIRANDFDKAVAYRHRVQDNFLGWLNQQKPDITPDEVSKKYNEIKAQALDATAPLDFTPGLAPSFDDINGLLEDPGSTPDGSPGVLPAKPTEPKTSAIQFKDPIKLSNYGYSSDSTPDSNSAAGIGHRDNKLIDGRSAAITKSLADQIGLKHGDWFQVNTSRGKFKLQYADTVPAYDKRTGPLPPTIDIYRRKGGSNNWGGKIYSLEKLATPPDTASTGSLEERKAAYFRDQRPTTPDEAELGIAALYDDFYAEQAHNTLDA